MSQGYNVQTLPNFRIQDGFPIEIFPVGMITPFGGSTGPYGWLICDGSEIQRDLYPILFKIIGTMYGNGDGSTTFNVPNLTGRIPVGRDSESTEFPSLGSQGGQKYVALSTSELPSHSHGVTDPGHTHNQTSLNDDFNNSAAGANGGYITPFTTPSYPRSDSTGNVTWTNTINSNTTGLTVNNTGNGDAHLNIQPYTTVNYIIKY